MDCLQLDDELEAWQRTAGDLRAYFPVGHMAIMCLVIISSAPPTHVDGHVLFHDV